MINGTCPLIVTVCVLHLCMSYNVSIYCMSGCVCMHLNVYIRMQVVGLCLRLYARICMSLGWYVLV